MKRLVPKPFLLRGIITMLACLTRGSSSIYSPERCSWKTNRVFFDRLTFLHNRAIFTGTSRDSNNPVAKLVKMKEQPEMTQKPRGLGRQSSTDPSKLLTSKFIHCVATPLACRIQESNSACRYSSRHSLGLEPTAQCSTPNMNLRRSHASGSGVQ